MPSPDDTTSLEQLESTLLSQPQSCVNRKFFVRETPLFGNNMVYVEGQRLSVLDVIAYRSGMLLPT